MEAVFVVRNDSGIKSPKDFAGKKFASPQLGNTQDIALRKYLLDNGYKTTDNGGNVTVTSMANPDILTLFLRNSSMVHGTRTMGLYISEGS